MPTDPMSIAITLLVTAVGVALVWAGLAKQPPRARKRRNEVHAIEKAAERRREHIEKADAEAAADAEVAAKLEGSERRRRAAGMRRR